MSYAIRHPKLAMVALFFAMAGLAGDAKPAVSAPNAAPQSLESVATSSSLRPEVRLRKLHLVRPDLIGYPLAYDIYC